jgi:hypothetical protein
MASVKTAAMAKPGLAQLAKGESQVLQQGGHGRSPGDDVATQKEGQFESQSVMNATL